MRAGMSEKLILTMDKLCPGCHRPLVTRCVNRQELIDLRERPGRVRLCDRCIALMLARATIATHGNVGTHPNSNFHRGHEDRMRDYEHRVSRYYRDHPGKEAREYFAAAERMEETACSS